MTLNTGLLLQLFEDLGKIARDFLIDNVLQQFQNKAVSYMRRNDKIMNTIFLYFS